MSNKLQEFCNGTNIISVFKTDHSSVSVTISSYNFLTHQIFKNHQIYCLNKLSRKEIYSILIESSDSKPSSQWYYKNVF